MSIVDLWAGARSLPIVLGTLYLDSRASVMQRLSRVSITPTSEPSAPVARSAPPTPPPASTGGVLDRFNQYVDPVVAYGEPFLG